MPESYNSKENTVYFGSWYQRVQSKIVLSCALGQDTIVVGMSIGKGPFTSWQTEKMGQ